MWVAFHMPFLFACTLAEVLLLRIHNFACRSGRLLRFSVRNGGLFLRDGELVGADLQFESLVNQRRGRADMCSKVLTPLVVWPHLGNCQVLIQLKSTCARRLCSST